MLAMAGVRLSYTKRNCVSFSVVTSHPHVANCSNESSCQVSWAHNVEQRLRQFHLETCCVVWP